MCLPPVIMRDLGAARQADDLQRAARRQVISAARSQRRRPRPDRTRAGPPLRARLWRYF